MRTNNRNNTTRLLLVIDGNMLFHRAFNAIPSMKVPDTGEEVGAVYGTISILWKVLQDQKPTHAAVCFDRPEPTFRKLACSSYKSGSVRLNDVLAGQMSRIRQVFMVFGIPIYECQGFEGDDLCGTISYNAERQKYNVLVMTEDMDAFQLVTKRTKVLRSKELIDIEAVIHKIGVRPELIPDYKALAGDDGDCIPQVPGVGGKTAVEILKHGFLIWLLNQDSLQSLVFDKSKRVREAYLKITGEYRDQVLLSQFLATIRTDVPIRFDIDDCELVYDIATRNQVLALIDDIQSPSLYKRIERNWPKTNNAPSWKQRTMI